VGLADCRSCWLAGTPRRDRSRPRPGHDRASPENADRPEGGDARRPSFLVGDVASLAFPDGSFDLVVSTLSMHHWADPTAGLAEIGRVLRPGGRALVWDFRAGPVPLHGHLPDPVEHAHGSPLHVVDATPWRWPWRFNLIRRIELVRAVDVSPPCGNVDPGPTRRPASTDKPPTSGGEVLDTVILAIATALAVVGVGGLIVDGVRAARADGGRRFSADLGWTLLWAAGLSALFVAAWATRR